MSADRTIHVVDDDAAVRRSLERLLDAAGFRVLSYQSPLEFLRAAPGLSAGCILLDLRMPGMDGLQVQARLNQLGVSLPVIVMTGHGDVPSAVRAMKAGAIDFIEKPYNEETLLNAIEGALAKTHPAWSQSRGGASSPAHRCTQPARAGSPRWFAGGTPEQGNRFRSRHQCADGGGASCAHDGTAWNETARGCRSSRGHGQIGGADPRPW